MKLTQNQQRLTESLLNWYFLNARALPWRVNRDPYRIWVSEIMLQQTRVEAVKAYYVRFMEQVPTVQDLAMLEEERLLKLWEGLGYYSRARNLKKTAVLICTTMKGVFPQTLQGLLALPGIGDYTAGAIASMAFEAPTPAVDGNVLRVIARLTGSTADITKPATKIAASTLLKRIYPPKGERGDFTQALMELGATVCLPNGPPLCATCPVGSICTAKAQGTQGLLPVKTKKPPRKIEEKTMFLITVGESLALVKRTEKGVLQGMWAYPSVQGKLTAMQAQAWLQEQGLTPLSVVQLPNKKHIFTHIEWQMAGYEVQCQAPVDQFEWVSPVTLKTKISLPSAYKKW